MKLNHILIGIAITLASCSTASAPLVPAENGLDAGREFINACLKGDFERAAFYMVESNENKALLNQIETTYREKDKEGRQELRTASINIREVSEPNAPMVPGGDPPLFRRPPAHRLRPHRDVWAQPRLRRAQAAG